MDIKKKINMDIKIGQRWLFKNYRGSFIGEVEKHDIGYDVSGIRVVQVTNWSYPIGHFYSNCHLTGNQWTYCVGQDKPE
jgi:hypothetical protein